MKPLFQICFIYSEADQAYVGPYATAVERAFELVMPDPLLSDLEKVPDLWERIHFHLTGNGEAWSQNKLKDDASIPTLFVVIVTENLVEDEAMRQVLEAVASLLPKRPEEGNCDLLSFSLSAIAMTKLPKILSQRQVKAVDQLGEQRLAPHKLGLVALHRARLLLGETRRSESLQIFISHAKLDGIFLAHSLKHSIEQVPELSAWYDAKDIETGSDWATQIDDAAATCVFIAVRTNTYELRKVCREEFMAAFEHGVPLVVVDALMRPICEPSPLPFACVPNVRIPDGNTFRVLLTVLREHLRLLLMRASALEKKLPRTPRVWLRLPMLCAVRAAWATSLDGDFWLVSKSRCHEPEFRELRDWLASVRPRIELEQIENFRPTPFLT